jgi:hypothetical protein
MARSTDNDVACQQGVVPGGEIRPQPLGDCDSQNYGYSGVFGGIRGYSGAGYSVFWGVFWGQPSIDPRPIKSSRCLRPAVSHSLRKRPARRTDTDRSAVPSCFRSGFHRFRTTDARSEQFSKIHHAINPEFRRNPKSIKQRLQIAGITPRLPFLI